MTVWFVDCIIIAFCQLFMHLMCFWVAA